MRPEVRPPYLSPHPTPAAALLTSFSTRIYKSKNKETPLVSDDMWFQLYLLTAGNPFV